MNGKSHIISLSVNNLSFRDSLAQIVDWGLKRQSGFVCFANVHMVIEAHKSEDFKKDLEKASLILPDGKPLAVACNWLYRKKQERISGMDFTPALLQRINSSKAKVFLYGSTPEVLQKIKEQIDLRYPDIVIGGSISPPFRQLLKEEVNEHIDAINASGSNFVLVSLGCPKQEKWMAENYSKINAILLGVGGAFPVLAKLQKRSPRFMQSASMEWLFRLGQEPKRLIKRYTYTNLFFIALLSKALLKKK